MIIKGPIGNILKWRIKLVVNWGIKLVAKRRIKQVQQGVIQQSQQLLVRRIKQLVIIRIKLAFIRRIKQEVNVLDLLDLLLRLVINLFFNCLIFDSFLNSFLWNIFHILIIDNSFLNFLLWVIFNVYVLEYLRNIFGLIFDCVIIGDSSLFRDVFGSLNYLIFHHNLFVRNVFDSTFSFLRWLSALDLNCWNKLCTLGLCDLCDWLLYDNSWLLYNLNDWG